MYEIRMVGRGGQGAKTAARVIGTAAFLEGKQAQDLPIYGAERRGAPVYSFVRIDESFIGMRGYIPSPDMVVVLDDSLFTMPGANATKGLKADGTLVANSSKSEAEIRKIANVDKRTRVVLVNATSIALETIGKPIPNLALLGAVVSANKAVKFGSLEAAIRKEMTEEKGMPEDKILKNIEAARKCHEVVRLQQGAKTK